MNLVSLRCSSVTTDTRCYNTLLQDNTKLFTCDVGGVMKQD